MASLEQQAYEYSQRKYNEYKAQQDQLDEAANIASGKRTAARIQLNEAQKSGNAAEIAAAQSNFDNAKAASVVASERANNNLIRLTDAENAVERNGVLAANAAEGKRVGIDASSPTTSVTDPAAERTAANANAVLDTPVPVNDSVITTPYEEPFLDSNVDITGVESPETTDPYVPDAIAFDEDGNLISEPEATEPYVAGEDGDSIDDKYTNADGETITDQEMGGPSTGAEEYTQGQGENRNQVIFPAQKDWRFRISLSPLATYLYNDPSIDKDTDILGPLVYTQGVVFPYLPSISMSHSANYDATDLAHTNYKIYQYRNSNVGDISIQAEFTAQDTNEANYLLATMHFFKCVTKMFYGRDEDPRAGTPPPLVYLSGYGAFQFDYHPVAITSFTYTLPNDVDYIRAGVVGQMGGQDLSQYRKEKQLPTTNVASLFASFFRLNGSGLRPGASYPRPNFTQTIVNDPTYVPTKISIQLNCIPMISRYNMANKFSLRDYAKGTLSRGSKTQTGGMW